jgi:hypothetical protein
LRVPKILMVLTLLLVFAAGPLRAQWAWGGNPEDLFASQRFDELERAYARVLAARSRNHWGEFHTEEFVRRLYLALTGSPPKEIAAPTEAELESRTQAWVKHSPRSAPAAIARATHLLQRAEASYGAQNWPAGDSMTNLARQLLLQVRDASKSDPNWHAAWLYIGKLQGWDPQEVMDAIEAAADAEPGAAGPWQVAVDALSPNRKGAGLLPPLVELAVRKSNASEGWSLYARIYLHAARTYPAVHRDPFGSGGMQWSKTNLALIDLYTRYPNPGVLNQHAILACLAGDKPATAALLRRIGAHPDPAWWRFWGGEPLYERCKARASEGTV